MKIYDTPGFPNPARIRIVLAEKGLDSGIEFVKVDLFGAEHKQAPFLAKNPNGVVPVLELDDGTCIAECIAITIYLDNLDGHPILTGVTPREKALIQMMEKRADEQMIDAIGIYFHYGTPGLGPQLEAYKEPDWPNRNEWAQRQLARFQRGMDYFDTVLRGQPYVAGALFSVADITVYAALLQADAAGVVIPAGLTALLAWRRALDQRPSIQNRGGQVMEMPG